MRLVSLTRLLPALVVVALALPAPPPRSRRAAQPRPPPPAADVALVASPQRCSAARPCSSGTVAAPCARPHPARAALRRGRPGAGDRRPARPSVARAASASAGAPGARPQRLRATLQRRRAATVTSASPEVSVRVFKPGMATWYGPGLYGNTTACGQELTRDLVGVAHKTLPCGTLVEVSYGGRSIVVPVIDRGPFVKRHDLGPDLGRRRAARLHRDGAHRRARPGSLL